ncbi:MAG: Hsp20/alpha crystallin family protein [Gemmatimonadetes bacterium]|nr:Hsp20/alpha crystallin family protein [Gemmatimonadota bacterium]NNM05388.1 Hsp20/alpha crystallin family protein [Gemmatimonadota bacterium]
MSITRYTRRSPFLTPWIQTEGMPNRLNRLFGEPRNGQDSGGLSWAPPVNVEESGEELLLTAELPGLGIEDVVIEVENNVLTLEGEKRQERKEGDEGRYHLRERMSGSFKRTFTLPRSVKTEAISAEMRDGVLLVRMPKAPEALSRRIEVKG